MRHIPQQMMPWDVLGRMVSFHGGEPMSALVGDELMVWLEMKERVVWLDDEQIVSFGVDDRERMLWLEADGFIAQIEISMVWWCDGDGCSKQIKYRMYADIERMEIDYISVRRCQQHSMVPSLATY